MDLLEPPSVEPEPEPEPAPVVPFEPMLNPHALAPDAPVPFAGKTAPEPEPEPEPEPAPTKQVGDVVSAVLQEAVPGRGRRIDGKVLAAVAPGKYRISTDMGIEVVVEL